MLRVWEVVVGEGWWSGFVVDVVVGDKVGGGGDGGGDEVDGEEDGGGDEDGEMGEMDDEEDGEGKYNRQNIHGKMKYLGSTSGAVMSESAVVAR